MEINENTRITRLTSDRAIDEQNFGLNISVTNSSDFADILVRGEADRSSLSEVERARFDNYTFSRLGAYENVIANNRDGLMSETEFQVWTDLFQIRLGKPGYREFWQEYRMGYFPEFRAWADVQFEIDQEH